MAAAKETAPVTELSPMPADADIVTPSAIIVEPNQSIQGAINSTPGAAEMANPFDAALGDVPTSDLPAEAAAEMALSRYEEDLPPTNMTSLSMEPDLDASEVALPRLRLAQGLTQEVNEGTAKAGQWVLTGEDPLDAVTVIPLMMGRSRVARDPEDKEGRTILCSSDDARTGVGQNPVNGNCAVCPLKDFQQDPRTGRSVKPACSLTYRYLVWSIDHGALLEVHFSKTATHAAKYINTFVSTKKLGRFAIQLSSKSTTSNNRTFYVPAVKLVQVDAGEFDVARAAVAG